MPLIEGIGDEVTILVTLIVAVTTIVAAWFSTSVTEQQPYWQDIPGSAVDPEPSSQASSYSDDVGQGISETAESSEETISRNADEEPVQASGSEPSEQVASNSEVEGPGSNDQATSDDKVGAFLCVGDEDGLKADSQSVEVTRQGSASGSSSFECIDQTNSEVFNESRTLKKSAEDPSDVDVTDGVSTYENPPDDIVQERVEDVEITSEEHSCVRRRHAQSAEATCTASNASSEGSEPPSTLGQSVNSCHTEKRTDSQSGRVSQDVTDSNSQRPRDQPASGVITIKLRFLDETERIVSTNMADTLGNFRRETFSAEIQAGQTVRLISNGQLLSEDHRTLTSYGITNQQVIHCQISNHASSQQHPRGQQQQTDTGEGEFDLGRYMVPLFGCILAFLWYLRFQYRYMFNATSTLSLTAVSAVFILALLASWRS